MSAVLHRPSIKLLSAQLADQIAAGEVIERPASVLKELIENALDAHCNRIDIELGAGGMERIRVSDNGEGISCDELTLAISRHATSKLSSIQDLLALQTLGFRGEALASICSVSQWQISSCTSNAAHACKLSKDMSLQPIPDHHPQGTTVLIEKLFHNTPARRKFLRAERTEYRHCDDLVRRMALARFEVAFFVKHNGRQVHRLPAVSDDIGRTRRVSQLCGEQFVRDALAIDYPHAGMRVWGWISSPTYTRQQADLQYFYINGRIVRDRMLNHAIRLAYQNRLPTGRQMAYVLHLEIEPDRFDVNVHPTKQEVRFRETRLIHDFIVRSLRQALDSGPEHSLHMVNHTVAEAPNEYRYEATANASRAQGADMSDAPRLHDARPSLLFNRYLFTNLTGKPVLIDLGNAYARWASRHWYRQIMSGKVVKQPLLLPERFKLTSKQATKFHKRQSLLATMGFDLSLISMSEVILRFVPAVITPYSPQAIIEQVLDVAGSELQASHLFDLLTHCKLDAGSMDIKLILDAISCDPDAYSGCYREISAAQLEELFR